METTFRLILTTCRSRQPSNVLIFRFTVEAKIMPLYGSVVVIRGSGADGSIFPLINEVQRQYRDRQIS